MISINLLHTKVHSYCYAFIRSQFILNSYCMFGTLL